MIKKLHFLSRLLITALIFSLTAVIYTQSRGTPNSLRVLTDANGAVLIAATSQTLPLSQPTTFSNTRLATDSSGNLLVVLSGGSGTCSGDCVLTNILFPPSPSTSSTGIIYKGAALAGNRFIHDFSPVGSNAENTFVGLGAGNFTMTFSSNEDSSLNTGIGWHAMAAITTAFANVFVGDEAGMLCTTCNLNVGVGHQAGTAITNADSNTMIGTHAGKSITTGDGNTLIGNNAGSKIVTTGSNTAVGSEALSNTTSFSNTAVGFFALAANVGGFANVAVGDSALTVSQNVISNVAIGYAALTSANGGNGQNTCVGTNCGGSLVTGDNNVLLGNGADNTLSSATNSIVIGSTATAAASNTTVIGTSSTTLFRPFGTFVTSGAALAVANVGANSCGTTAATITGNDNTGEITVGATAGTVCRVTFAVAAPTRRMCTANDSTTTVAVRTTYVDTTHTDFIGTFTAADVVSFVCLTR